MTTNQIQSERVERADPDSCRFIGCGHRYSLGQLSGGAVGKRENENRGGIDSFFEERENAFDQRSGLARPGTGLELKWRTAMRCGSVLCRIRKGRTREGRHRRIFPLSERQKDHVKDL